MRTLGPNIYRYRRGKYTKNPLEEYKIENTINNPPPPHLKPMVDQEQSLERTKLMVGASLNLREELYQLAL
jgi:hypothetical protein